LSLEIVNAYIQDSPQFYDRNEQEEKKEKENKKNRTVERRMDG